MPDYGENEDRARKSISAAFGVKPSDSKPAGSAMIGSQDSSPDVFSEAMKRSLSRIKQQTGSASAGE